ncbi:hypothetical protein, partial [Sinorhizobium fredii]|uniref:hypothetical protein n=1 Tax=Rhizobium fredii TaxID=380 RepID=UPI0024E0CD01
RRMKAICASVNFDVFMKLSLPRQPEHNWKIPVQNDPICGKHVTSAGLPMPSTRWPELDREIWTGL